MTTATVTATRRAEPKLTEGERMSVFLSFGQGSVMTLAPRNALKVALKPHASKLRTVRT